ncbi:immunity 26/phosphotriesterase HocA family protein [Arthrobacter sp. Cr_A7]|uniref:immunity 26/phosphotriesterase HocA family protein n=1 Tax=Arthrobacter sp. Cr_A7 TaxID=3031017 RepID=UPI0023DBE4EF|nr:immunity 26/phosphotriesterase HocA family protein [Arthrobacter sp. Cr_A7]MDF2050601.1 immunity 26/phosphotriesterase HocA family protein [Arthrobacter sp. Cr_A7]
MSDINLRVLKPSRKRPASGDIFALQMPDEKYLFGRVVAADLPSTLAPMPGSYLIYVYDHVSAAKSLAPGQLTRDCLLLPPVFINRMPWTKGYFETIGTQPLSEKDVLAQHCFRRWTGEYLDDRGQRLPGPVEPCGDWGLSSYRWLDDQISDKLGFPRTPE